MEDIDDSYKQEVETIDSNFLEEVKRGTNRKISLEKYQSALGASMDKFRKNYEKHLKEEIVRVRKKKEKIEKIEKFKRLKVGHVEMTFSFFDRIKIRFNIGWFRFSRWIRGNIIKRFPRLGYYIYYKLLKEIKYFFSEAFRILGRIWKSIKEYIAKKSIIIWKSIKWLYEKIRWAILKLISKAIFWKKIDLSVRKEKEKGDKEKKEGDRGKEGKIEESGSKDK